MLGGVLDRCPDGGEPRTVAARRQVGIPHLRLPETDPATGLSTKEARCATPRGDAAKSIAPAIRSGPADYPSGCEKGAVPHRRNPLMSFLREG